MLSTMVRLDLDAITPEKHTLIVGRYKLTYLRDEPGKALKQIAKDKQRGILSRDRAVLLAGEVIYLGRLDGYTKGFDFT